MRTAALAAAGLLGDYRGAAARRTEAHTLAHSAGDAEGTLRVLSNRAIVAWLRGDATRLPGFLAEYEALRSAAPWTLAYALHALGLLAGEQRRSPTTLECLETSLELYESVGDRYRAVAVQSTLAAVAFEHGDVGRARARVTAALTGGGHLRNLRTVVFGADVALCLVGASTAAGESARLLGAVDTLRLRDAIGFRRTPRGAARYQTLCAALEAVLGQEALAGARRSGRVVSPDALVEGCLALLGAGRDRSAPGPLSRREREVLSLIAGGRTNKGVAKALGVSPSTVNFHVTSVFDKLGVRTRAEAVARAAERGLLQPEDLRVCSGPAVTPPKRLDEAASSAWALRSFR